MLSPHSSSPAVRMLCGFFVSLLAVMLLSAGWSSAQADTSTPGVSAKQGDAIFHKRCVGCHNKQRDDDSPFGPPNLYIALHSHGSLSPKEAETIVTNGKGPMPAFGHVLSRSEIRSVIAYLRSH